jgi:hypothetical protein
MSEMGYGMKGSSSKAKKLVAEKDFAVNSWKNIMHERKVYTKNST